MQIKTLKIKNCLGITELDLNPGKVNVISGGNEKGKTSILECLEKAVNNNERRAKFIKDGATEGTLYIEMDNGLEINRKIKSTGTESLKLSKDGVKQSAPQTMLKSLVGGFNFNPIDFLQKDDKQQTDILLGIIPMHLSEEMLQEWFGEVPEVDLTKHPIEILKYLSEKYFYDKRTTANAKLKECENELSVQLSQLPNEYDVEKWRNAVISEKWKVVDKAKEVNKWIDEGKKLLENNESAKESINNKYDLKVREQNELLEFKIDKVKKSVNQEKEVIQNDIIAKENNIKEYEKLIAKLKQDIILKQQELSNIDKNVIDIKAESLKNENAIELKSIEANREKELSEFDTRIVKAEKYIGTHEYSDIESLEKEAEETEKMKSFITVADNVERLKATLYERETVANNLNECVEIARKKPTELIKNAVMPIKGLGIENGVITIDGLPIKNLSTSRQIKLALDIAKATSGELKLINIDKFESLDKEQKDIFISEANKDDFQYFITEVTAGELNVETK